jgi:hypothetical protein
MELNKDDNPKPKLVFVSSIWMGLVGLLIIIFDGIFLSINNPTRSIQESVFIGLIGLFATGIAYGYWRENPWASFASAVVSLGAAFFNTGFHTMIYLLSPVITAVMMTFHYKFGQSSQTSEKTNSSE